MKCSKKLGFTLVETLMAIVIGVISVAAIFYSYQFFNKSYQGILDKSSISRSGREVLRMIARDLRNAGYKDVNYTRASKLYTHSLIYTIATQQQRLLREESELKKALDELREQSPYVPHVIEPYDWKERKKEYE